MPKINALLVDPKFDFAAEYDSNEGGDGARIRLRGTPDGFRVFAAMLEEMAAAVDDPDRPESIGWQFGISSKANDHLDIVGAKLLTLDCIPLEILNRYRETNVDES